MAWSYNLDLPTCVTSMKSLQLWKTKSGAPARWTIATARLVGLNEASTSSSNPVNSAQISVTDCGSFAWELTRSNLARARKLWDRLRQHRGTNRPSGGNHRGSIFRLLVGNSLIERDGVSCPSWELGKSKPRKASERNAEEALERKVSSVIGSMPFLWLAVEDDPGPRSIRGYIERNTIALLSNYDRPPLDPPSRDWLGTWCDRERVRASGLWNNRHVEEQYRPEFLETLNCLVNAMGRN